MDMDIITIEGTALRDLLHDVALGGVRTLRVARDGDTVKFKLNEDMWSPGYPEAHEDAYRRELKAARTR